jgi:hypothetical protein
MADKKSTLKGFNTHFFDFFTYIIETISENDEIRFAKTSLEQIHRMNPTLIIKSWFSFIYLPYKDVIESGNIDFIINKDYKKDVSILEHADKIINVINKIRDPIRQMNEQQRERAIDFIKGLSKLSIMYQVC